MEQKLERKAKPSVLDRQSRNDTMPIEETEGKRKEEKSQMRDQE